ncbi:MAG TPA: chemotaxis response regulator protein-glutamate methylesterase [Thermoanaerobaculia bacterium]|nr:chemotaxis response regulator protein-glutamate methylesterase [Thermoanaerobaculia bacterium]
MNVLVIDDSAVVRQAFAMLLGKQFAIETAADPIIAERKIEKRRPDVIVLDLQMPRMDGFTFLRQLMRRDPIPVVICSAQGSEIALRALEEGAVDVILKPQAGVREFLEESVVLLADTLSAAAQARVVRGAAGFSPPKPDGGLKPAAPPRVIAIGASTGGTEALRSIIEALPADAPPMLVVQHMPEGFTRAFAKRLDATARVQVKEAIHGDLVVPGRVLIAPGNQHMMLRGRYVQLASGALVSRHRPSVDVLFHSVAREAGAKAIGVILTGMGDDGADGLKAMRRAGAHTIAQDEASSVIFGMPKEAIARGAVAEILSLAHIPFALLRHTQRSLECVSVRS